MREQQGLQVQHRAPGPELEAEARDLISHGPYTLYKTFRLHPRSDGELRKDFKPESDVLFCHVGR